MSITLIYQYNQYKRDNKNINAINEALTKFYQMLIKVKMIYYFYIKEKK